MKKKYQAIVSVGAAAIMAFSSSVTAMAAPEVIQVNGENTVFDCEYYAANNLDVAAACGTDREALIQHYISYGMKEGRAAYAPGTDVAALLGTEPQAGAETAETPAVSRDWLEIKLRGRRGISVHQDGNIGTKPGTLPHTMSEDEKADLRAQTEAFNFIAEQEAALGMPANEYIATLWSYDTAWNYDSRPMSYEIQYCILTPAFLPIRENGIYNATLYMTFSDKLKQPGYVKVEADPNLLLNLKSYYVPGYEWRILTVGRTEDLWFDGSADNSKDWKPLDTEYRDAYSFTIVQGGVEYPECKLLTLDYEKNPFDGGLACMLVPKGYTGNAYYHIYGNKIENDGLVKDTSHRLTTLFPKVITDSAMKSFIDSISY